jgi:50S ribosomal subunit-associated GTPase HflX
VDLISPDEKMDLKRKGIIAVSAKTREGLDEMLGAIELKLNESLMEVMFDLPHNKHYLVGEIYRAGAVLSEESHENGVRVMARIDSGNWKRITHQINLAVK